MHSLGHFLFLSIIDTIGLIQLQLRGAKDMVYTFEWLLYGTAGRIIGLI